MSDSDRSNSTEISRVTYDLASLLGIQYDIYNEFINTNLYNVMRGSTERLYPEDLIVTRSITCCQSYNDQVQPRCICCYLTDGECKLSVREFNLIKQFSELQRAKLDPLVKIFIVPLSFSKNVYKCGSVNYAADNGMTKFILVTKSGRFYRIDGNDYIASHKKTISFWNFNIRKNNRLIDTITYSANTGKITVPSLAFLEVHFTELKKNAIVALHNHSCRTRLDFSDTFNHVLSNIKNSWSATSIAESTVKISVADKIIQILTVGYFHISDRFFGQIASAANAIQVECIYEKHKMQKSLAKREAELAKREAEIAKREAELEIAENKFRKGATIFTKNLCNQFTYLSAKAEQLRNVNELLKRRKNT